LQKKSFIKDLGEEVEFYVWDTAGQEEFNSLTRKYYKGASAAIVCFSTIDKDSFDHVEKWAQQVEMECGDIMTVLCQTKVDLLSNAQVTVAEGDALAKKLGRPIYRTSTKDNVMVNEIFEHLATKFFKKNMHKVGAHNPISTVDEINQQSLTQSLSMSHPRAPAKMHE